MRLDKFRVADFLTPPEYCLVEGSEASRVLEVDVCAVLEEEFYVFMFAFGDSEVESRAVSCIPDVQIYLKAFYQEQKGQETLIKLCCTMHQPITVL